MGEGVVVGEAPQPLGAGQRLGGEVIGHDQHEVRRPRGRRGRLDGAGGAGGEAEAEEGYGRSRTQSASAWWVLGNMSRRSRRVTVYPAARAGRMSRARAAGLQET